MAMMDIIIGATIIFLVIILIGVPVGLLLNWIKQRRLKKAIPLEVKEQINSERGLVKNAIEESKEETRTDDGRAAEARRGYLERAAPDLAGSRILQPGRSIQSPSVDSSAKHKPKFKLHKPTDL
jgi:hypothetical protein